MKTDKVFKWIWNVNGTVLLLGLILTLTTVSYELIKGVFKSDSPVRPSLNLAEDEDGEEQWSLGYPNRIGTSDYYYVPLESEKLHVKKQSRLKSFSSYDHRSTRSKNVVFINGNTNDSNWLFESVQQLIIEIRLLSTEHESMPVAKAILYEVINNDTNKDGILDGSDKRTFSLSDIDGTRYSEIIEGYSRIIESELNRDGNLFVVYIDGKTVYTMLIDLRSFSILDKKPLPKVNDS